MNLSTIHIEITSTELCAGKTTLAALIANALQDAGITDIEIREGERHTPEYAEMYQRRMQELRAKLREGISEIYDRRILITEKTIDK